MNLQKISKALEMLNTSMDDPDTAITAIQAIREEGKDVDIDRNTGVICATGTYTPPTSVKEFFERVRSAKLILDQIESE